MQKNKNFCLYHGTGLASDDQILLNIIKDPTNYFRSNCQDPWKGIWCSKVPQVAVAYASRWDGQQNRAGTMLQVNVLNNSLFVQKKKGKPLQPTDIPKENWKIDGKGVYAGQHAEGSLYQEYLVKLGESIKIKIHPDVRVILDQGGFPQIQEI